MKNRRVLRPLAGLGLVGATWLLATACGASRNTGQEAKTGNEAVASEPAASSPATPSEAAAVPTPPASSLDALPPPDTDTSAQSRHSLTMTESRGTIDPSSNAIPSPRTKLDTPSQSGIDAAIKAVPSTVGVGTLSRSQLEAPLRDRARFDHCRSPYGTHGEISAVVYNGAASSVEVKTNPNDRALNFCIERAVRQMTWVKELAVNKVKVSF
jgi:hypothetical protein